MSLGTEVFILITPKKNKNEGGKTLGGKQVKNAKLTES